MVHLSATAFGGGVAEILYTLVPLMKDVGLDVEWQVIYGREEFFNATKLMHNALQGNPQDLTEEQWETWARYNEMNARELAARLGRLHRARPAAGGDVQLVPEKARGWVWRCHIDVSTPNPATIERLLPYIAELPAVAVPRRATTCRPGWAAASTSCRRRSTRWRRRTWRCRPRTRRTSATSSASTSTGR